MDFCLSTAVCHVCSGCNMFIQTNDLLKQRRCLRSNAICFASKKGGFGPDTSKNEKFVGVIDVELLNDNLGLEITLNPSILKSKDAKKMKNNSSYTSETRNFVSGEPKTRVQQAPQLSSGKSRNLSNAGFDQKFLEKVEAVRRSALEQKKSEEDKIYQAIDYDAPIEPEQNTIGFGTKVGIGVAVLVFGLVFALGDFLPYGSVNSTEDAATIGKQLTEEEKSILKMKLAEYKKTLRESPEDPIALEGAVVTMEDLGEYEEASSLLEKLTKESPNNADALRLLGDVKFELKDFDGSASAYKKSLSASDIIDFEVLRGLTNSLLAAKHPDMAVQILLNYREKLSDGNIGEKVNSEKQSQSIDPIQVDLLLGKAYSNWGHESDAVAVYDQLISKHPDDFRGYLAKGIILKGNGSTGDAERMFIQARFFAPEKMKELVDHYSGGSRK